MILLCGCLYLHACGCGSESKLLPRTELLLTLRYLMLNYCSLLVECIVDA